MGENVLSPVRIAVAEDEPDVRKTFVRLLEYLGHKVVFSVANGKELIDQCLQDEVDVAFVDLDMPVVDGSGRRRSHGRTRDSRDPRFWSPRRAASRRGTGAGRGPSRETRVCRGFTGSHSASVIEPHVASPSTIRNCSCDPLRSPQGRPTKSDRPAWQSATIQFPALVPARRSVASCRQRLPAQ